jgi:hypothetical protein
MSRGGLESGLRMNVLQPEHALGRKNGNLWTGWSLIVCFPRHRQLPPPK